MLLSKEVAPSEVQPPSVFGGMRHVILTHVHVLPVSVSVIPTEVEGSLDCARDDVKESQKRTATVLKSGQNAYLCIAIKNNQ